MTSCRINRSHREISDCAILHHSHGWGIPLGRVFFKLDTDGGPSNVLKSQVLHYLVDGGHPVAEAQTSYDFKRIYKQANHNPRLAMIDPARKLVGR